MLTKKTSFTAAFNAAQFKSGKIILGTQTEYRVFGLLIYKKELISPQVTLPELTGDVEIITHQ